MNKVMKRTKIQALVAEPPRELFTFLADATLYDSSCSPEANVYFIDKDQGYYLKTAPARTLSGEAQMTAYFHQKGLGPEVLFYRCDGERDWLLCERVLGEDCTHAQYLEDPKRLCVLLAERLRALHELPACDCPIPNRTATYLRTVEENRKKGHFDLSLFPKDTGFASADSAYEVFLQGKDALRADVLLHGDYCLPNIMLDNWRFSGFIDLGNGGVGDRHIDLFWGAWTLRFNLDTDAYRARFLDAYGRDKVEEELLRVVAAAEIFG